MTTVKSIEQTTWLDDDKRWDLQGLAQAMYAWLGSRAPGSSQIKGWQLAGTLDPDHADPTNIPKPPSWRTPTVMMQSLCAWYAAATQDYLFQNGLAPLVRARVDILGNPTVLFAAGVDVLSWRTLLGPTTPCFYFVVDQQAGPYQLSTAMTAIVTPNSLDPLPASIQPVSSDSSTGFQPIPGDQRPVGVALFSAYQGFQIVFGDNLTALSGYYIHLFA